MHQDSEARQSATFAQLGGLFRRWRAVWFAIVAAVVAFSAWQGMHVTPVYKSRTAMEIGYYVLPSSTAGSADSREAFSPSAPNPLGVTSDVRQIESSFDLKQRLEFAHWDKRKTPSSRLPRLQAIEIDRRKKRYVVLVAYGASPESARDYLQTIGDRLISEHRDLFDRTISELEAQLRRVKFMTTAIQAQIEKLPNISRQSKPEEIMLAATRLRLLEMLPGLLQWQADLEQGTAPGLNRPTRYVNVPQLERKPVSFGLTHYLVIGFALGVILASLFVTVSERVRVKIDDLRSVRAA